jgi:hypothetical protein
MKVTLTETGGWMNIRRSCTVDTHDLPPQDARTVEQALDRAELFKPRPAPAGACDARTIVLEFTTVDEHKRTTFTDASIPDEAISVLEILLPRLCVVRTTAS